MEDITVFLWIGAFLSLLIQYLVRVPPVFFVGELLGVGGLLCTLNEVDQGTLSGELGMLMLIAMGVVILYSTLNFMDHYWPTKRGMR